MERKVIKRLSNTSYWSDGEGLWLKPNVGGDFREKEVVVMAGRRWNKDVGFLDSYFKESFSEIPEIQFVRKDSPKPIEEIVIEDNSIVKIVVGSEVKVVPSRKRGRPRVDGEVSARAMRYRRMSSGESRSSGRPKKAPTS